MIVSIAFKFIYTFILYKTMKAQAEGIKVMNDGHTDMLKARLDFYKSLSNKI